MKHRKSVDCRYAMDEVCSQGVVMIAPMAAVSEVPVAPNVDWCLVVLRMNDSWNSHEIRPASFAHPRTGQPNDAKVLGRRSALGARRSSGCNGQNYGTSDFRGRAKTEVESLVRSFRPHPGPPWEYLGNPRRALGGWECCPESRTLVGIDGSEIAGRFNPNKECHRCRCS
jgi:hypothetical protein